MAPLDLQHLEYGIIYVCGNPKQTSNLRWFASMIEPMIRPLPLKWVETWGLDHSLIVARRFNVGNMGKYATVQLHLNKYGRSDSYSLLAAVHVFSDCLADVMDVSEGDVIINENDYGDRNEPPQGKWGHSTTSEPMGDVLGSFKLDEIPQDHTRVKGSQPQSFDFHSDSPDYGSPAPQEGRSRHEGLIVNLRNKLRRLRHDDDVDYLAHDDESVCEDVSLDSDYQYEISPDSEGQDLWSEEAQQPAPVEQIDLEAEEVLEFNRIESEYERDVKDLRARVVAFIAKYHQDPQQVIATMLEGKVLLGTTPGRMLVNSDMKIVLPEYDEMEIKMSAMCRTLYILFMKKRLQGEGIVLRDMDHYREELVDIYTLVKPGASHERVQRTVDNLCNPLCDSLNQTISRINGYVKKVITDPSLAQQYLVSGSRGEAYGIGLDPNLLQLPRAVTEA